MLIAAIILQVAVELTNGLHNMFPGHLTMYQDQGAGGPMNWNSMLIAATLPEVALELTYGLQCLEPGFDM